MVSQIFLGGGPFFWGGGSLLKPIYISDPFHFQEHLQNLLPRALSTFGYGCPRLRIRIATYFPTIGVSRFFEDHEVPLSKAFRGLCKLYVDVLASLATFQTKVFERQY